jgi:hypothetical protein
LALEKQSIHQMVREGLVYTLSLSINGRVTTNPIARFEAYTKTPCHRRFKPSPHALILALLLHWELLNPARNRTSSLHRCGSTQLSPSFTTHLHIHYQRSGCNEGSDPLENPDRSLIFLMRMGLSKSNGGDRGDRELLPFFIKGVSR